MTNSVFGRSMMNKRHRIGIKIVRKKKDALKYIQQTNFRFFNKISEGLYAFAMTPSCVKLNAPIYTGFSILELSKLSMFRFHYDFMKQIFPKTTVLASDTDSFIYEIQTTGDFYQKLKPYEDEFDFSEYPEQGFPNIVALRSEKNKKKLGTMKDEANGQICCNFVGLASKCYSLKIGLISKSACKGVPAIVKKESLNHDIFKSVLFTQRKVYNTSIHIRNSVNKITDQQLYTVECRKASLNAFDSKRWIRSDGIRTYPFGHYKTFL